MSNRTWCPKCGPGVTVDGYECCELCGATAIGDGAELAHRVVNYLADDVARLLGLRRSGSFDRDEVHAILALYGALRRGSASCEK